MTPLRFLPTTTLKWAALALLIASAGTLLNPQFAGAAANQDLDPTRQQLQAAIEKYQSALEDSDRNRRVQAFGQSETLFSQVIADQLEQSPALSPTAELYLNYGNAALGAEHLGVAIAAYRRALIVEPGNRRAQQNLEHARAMLPDWVPHPETERSGFGSLLTSLTLSTQQAMGYALITFCIAALLAAFYLRFDWNWARLFGFVAAVLWLGFLGGALFSSRRSTQTFAVVSVPEVTARSADSYNAPARISQPLPAGTELRMIEARGDWARVELSDGRQCWLPTQALALL